MADMENKVMETEENLSELLQVRRDKLSELQSEGRDPFQITKYNRTHTSGDIKNNYTEEEQYILDGVADGLNKICDDIEKGIADGTFIKPDYEATEAKISDFESAHPGEEYKEFIEEIKAELDGIKASNPKSHADVEDDLAAIEAKIDGVESCGHMCHKDGIVGFFWKIINFFCKLFRINPICECGIQHY